MDADFRFPSIYVPSTCTHRARRPPTRDTGGDAAGRAAGFVKNLRVTITVPRFRENARTRGKTRMIEICRML